MSDDLSQDPTLIQEFLVECEELLQRMDQDMVSLESSPNDADLLNRVFRSMHTIKGTAGFLGFEPIIRLSHRAEDVLNAVRRGEVHLNRSAMDALLAARDQLGKMLEDIRQGGLQEYALDSLLQDLDAAQSPARQPPPALGELLVNQEVISAATLTAVLAEQSSSAEPRKLGQMLVEKGLASQVEIGDALVRQKEMAQPPAAALPTMRVETRKLDELIDLIGELVLERNRLMQLSRDVSAGKVTSDCLHSVLGQSATRLSFITEELQTTGLKTRMVPIDTVFRKFPRLVRDVANSLRKEIDLEVRGEDTELDKTMVELIGDPLVHLVRNSLDHGIEAPAAREQAGKPRRGTIRLEASQEGDQIAIRIGDDGAGLDPERIGRKAAEKGLVTPERLRTMTEREILDFIFLPGFSTAEKTSEISGRGVGMDVVRSNLKKLNGSVELESRLHQGTTVKLRLPLTLAILPVLLVEVGDEIYGLPLRSVIETAQIATEQVHRVEGIEVLCLRGETLPLLRLDRLFSGGSPPGITSKQAGGATKVVILGVGEKRIALLVDSLVGQESTVIKPLGSYIHQRSSLAGATISGDGRVRLVLDPAGLLTNLQTATAPAARKASA